MSILTILSVTLESRKTNFQIYVSIFSYENYMKLNGILIENLELPAPSVKHYKVLMN